MRRLMNVQFQQKKKSESESYKTHNSTHKIVHLIPFIQKVAGSASMKKIL